MEDFLQDLTAGFKLVRIGLGEYEPLRLLPWRLMRRALPDL